jgi:hypothetical protein
MVEFIFIVILHLYPWLDFSCGILLQAAIRSSPAFC